MKLFKTISVISITVLLLGCAQEQPSEAKEFKSLMAKTIKVHDDVMPKMGDLTRSIKRLDTLKVEDSLQRTQTIKDLKNAHDEMMSWMKDLSNEFSRAEINEGLQTENLDSIKMKLNSLKTLNERANQMKTSIITSLEKAKAIK